MKYETIVHLANFYSNGKECQIKTLNIRDKKDLRSSFQYLSSLSDNHGGAGKK